MTDYTEPPIETGPETFVNTGRLIAHLKIKATELQAELKAVTGERDKYKEAIKEIWMRTKAPPDTYHHRTIRSICCEMVGDKK